MAEASLVTPINVQVLGLTVHGQYSILMTIFINRVIKEIIKRTMKITAALFLTTSVLFASNSNAQLGGLLKDLKTLSDKAQQINQRTTTSDATTNQSVTSAKNITDPSFKGLANSYCERVNAHPFVTMIADYSKKFSDIGSRPRFATFFEGREVELERWTRDKYYSLNFEFGVGYPTTDSRPKDLIAAINNCAQQSEQKPFGIYIKEFGGNPNSPLSFNQSTATSTISIRISQNLYWLMLFPTGSEEAINSANPKLISQLDDELSRRVRNIEFQNKQEASRQSEINERNQKARQKAQELEEKNKQEQIFANTPDGQLTIAYQNFQIIQLCHDLRKDFSVKFIGPTDYEDYRSKIKRIEQTLIKQTKEKDVNKLFALAERRNRTFNPTMGQADVELDVINTITNNAKGANFLTAKQDCDFFVNMFRNNVEKTLGQESIKKNF